MSDAGVATSVLVAVAAPLLVGSVHRLPLLGIVVVQFVALAMVTGAAASRKEPLRMGLPVALPLTLLIIPILQSIPLPHLLHAALDRRGWALLNDSVVPLAARMPLSLDPPSTRSHIAKAAAALATFLVAFHAVSGQRRRHWFIRAIGLTGVAALSIGVGHRVFGFTKIYGIVPSTIRTLIVGPFVNANHTAELLELAGFTCIACAHLRPTALNRIGWLVGAVLCFAGTMATLSRGSVVAIGIGFVCLLLVSYLGRDERPGRQRRAALAWGASLIGATTLLGAALGASQLLARFQSTATTQDIRFQLWRDSLHVLWAHPFGIGRGAFDRVYPVYRTLKAQLPMRFAFVENEPLQLLLDGGWVFFAALVVASALVVWRIVRSGRRDNVEAALLAGLLAVLVHNLVDFGLETPGVLLPFMAVAGTVLGRLEPPLSPPSARSRWMAIGLTCLGLVAGAAAIAHPSYDDFDGLLRQPVPTAPRRDLLVRAQQAHPTDYFYVLQYGAVLPLKPPPGVTASPRLHALNHALELCPSCGVIHQAIAQSLWQLSFKRQALLEWRSAIQLEPLISMSVLQQLFRDGGTPDEIAGVGSVDVAHMLEAAEFMNRAARPAQALVILDRAQQMGAPESAVLLKRAELQLMLNQNDEATATLARARAVGVRDPRLALMDVQLLRRTKGPDGADQALAILDAAAAQDPNDVDVQRARVDLILTYGRWSASERALAGFRDALYRSRGSAYEAHLVAGRIHGRLSHWSQAVDDFRMALADAPQEVPVWLELGHAAASAGRMADARDAYMQAARLAPQDKAVAKALHDLDERNRPAAPMEMPPLPGPNGD